MKGYIYILDYFKQKLTDSIKIGSTKEPYSRLGTYQTGFSYDVEYSNLYRIIDSKLDCYEIDDLIQKHFKDIKTRKITGEGGLEWYESSKISSRLLELFFKENEIIFERVKLIDCPKPSKEEIKRYCSNEGYKLLLEILELKNHINKDVKEDKNFKCLLEPYDYQKEVLDKKLINLRKDKMGKLLWSCGLGKTYMSLFISHKIGVKNILICVPNLYLLKQFRKAVKEIFNFSSLLLYGNGDNLDKIKKSLKENELNIVISTYHSCWRLLDLSDKFKFDIKIADEAHHIVSVINDKDKRTFEKFHKISSEYTLYMTATEKNLETNKDEIYTMSNEKQFGQIIDKKSVKWSIENKKITDYKLLCLQNDEEEINNIIEKIDFDAIVKENKLKDIKSFDKIELLISAFSALKLISEKISSHILIYTNSCISSDLIEIIINKLLENGYFSDIEVEKLYNLSLTSKSDVDLNKEISKFTNSKYGIIPCVYIFGEGVDIPKLDTVVIGEKMNTEIRIVQSCLRPNRLYKDNLDKIAKIVIPKLLSKIDDKLKMVVSHMANEDEMIEQKIEYIKINSIKNNISDKTISKYVSLEEDNKILNKIKLELYKGKCFCKDLTLQKEFELYHKIILDNKFKCVNDYLESDVKYKNPDIYFNGVWTDWFEFLGINTSKWIDNLIEWKRYCKLKGITDAKSYYKNLDDKLPPEPEYFYSNFKGINKELCARKYKYKSIKI